MTSRAVPEPPNPFDPLWETLPAGSRIFRVHEPRFPEAAVHESILHDAVPHAHVPRATWIRKVLTPLRTTRDLRLAQFHSEGLRRFGLHACDVTDTDSDQYPFTVSWALAAHRAGADGVVWMSRQLNSVRAYCLLGDRVPTRDIEPTPDDPDARVFATPADSEWLYDIAFRMRVTIRPTA